MVSAHLYFLFPAREANNFSINYENNWELFLGIFPAKKGFFLLAIPQYIPKLRVTPSIEATS